MSLRIRYHKIHLQAPECTILVAIGLDQLRKLADAVGLDPLLVHDVKQGYVDGCFGIQQVVYLFLPEEYNPVTTAHECIHAANRIWDSVGAHLTPDNDEVVCYTHDVIHTMIKELYNVPT